MAPECVYLSGHHRLQSKTSSGISALKLASISYGSSEDRMMKITHDIKLKRNSNPF